MEIAALYSFLITDGRRGITIKITREINGHNVEIGLTNQELGAAYREKQQEYDIEDVITYLEENEYPAGNFTEDDIQEIAMRSREVQDASDSISLALWGAVEYAVHSWIEENQKED